MNVSTLPLTVLRAEYTALRLPSRVLQTQIASRFAQDAPVRLGTDKFFGATDVLVGRLLGSPSLVERGETMQKHATTAAHAVSLQAKAQETREKADAELKASQEAAKEQRAKAQQEHKSDLAEARQQGQDASVLAERKAVARSRAEKDVVAQQAAAKAREATEKAQAAKVAAGKRQIKASADAKADLAHSEAVEKQADAKQAAADAIAGVVQSS